MTSGFNRSWRIASISIGMPVSGTAGVEQSVVRVAIAEEQRADCVSRSLRVRPSDDDELSGVEAFCS
jgi:hypothetical protein